MIYRLFNLTPTATEKWRSTVKDLLRSQTENQTVNSVWSTWSSGGKVVFNKSNKFSEDVQAWLIKGGPLGVV